jgi:2-polyprenyl-3-methyl-5-hydroxy-6-metoxy-1,4-benzoquinol methylase
MTTQSRWRSFWNNQSTPLHRHNDEGWYRRYAEEINCLVESNGYRGGPVLETGCGNGALFDYLNINKLKYVGTDLSEGLLKLFQSRHPELSLICADSSSFYTYQRFELIFSNGVIQYFDQAMLDLYIRNSCSMLEDGGILLMVNIPWRDLRNKFLSGELSKDPTSTAKLWWLWWLRTVLLRQGDGFGSWYNPRDFTTYSRYGFSMTVFGSLYHPYRFSLALKKGP